MTAVNIIRQSEQIIIVTDGAGYDAEGFVRAPLLKCNALPHLRAAVATRGGDHILPWATAVLGKCGSFDEVIRTGADRLREMHDHLPDLFPGAVEHEYQVLIAGWSEGQDKPMSYGLTTIESEAQGWTAWEWHELPADCIGPFPEPEHLEASGLTRLTSMEQFDPVRHGIALLDAQRASAYPTMASDQSDEEAPRHHLIGVFGLLTIVNRTGVMQQVIKHWPDRMAERIDLSSEPPATVQAIRNEIRQLSGADDEFLTEMRRLGREAAADGTSSEQLKFDIEEAAKKCSRPVPRPIRRRAVKEALAAYDRAKRVH